MPYSFTKIEEDKTRVIGFVFFFLIIFYFVSFWVIALCVKYYMYISAVDYQQVTRGPFVAFDWQDNLIILFVAGFAGFCHWQYTASNLLPKMSEVLDARPLDSSDSYHQMFQNIVEEVSVATGGKKMEAVIVPSMAMNAFALSDFSGRNIIGVTEGLLSRLTRGQIEAVVGHEAAHIVTGDCLTTTVTSSLFELYSGLLNRLCKILGHTNFSSRTSRGRDGGGVLLIIIVIILLFVVRSIGHFMRMFISRQREFRADAIAVRLTRDPLSLAEALYSISHHWSGVGLAAEELEAIFTINPRFSILDEQTNWFANLFSTHPPIKQRMQILLDMAHSDTGSLRDALIKKTRKPRRSVPEAHPQKANPLQWTVRKDNAWVGPFGLEDVMGLTWIKPGTWVQRQGSENVMMAQDDHELVRALAGDKEQSADGRSLSCPRCSASLSKVVYEGTEVDKCPFCSGTFLHKNDVQKIIIRRDVGFSDQIKKIAEGFRKEQKLRKTKTINRDPNELLVCPKCHNMRSKMNHIFYSPQYKVEVDHCHLCGNMWFDKDELEVLQCLIENS